MNHIELFAGCGGMALGLEAAGFELVMANEFSPMAAETFAYNILNEDLRADGIDNKADRKTLWISSGEKNIAERLSEDPYKYPTRYKNSDLIDNGNLDLSGKLIIGDIRRLNKYLKDNPNVLKKLSDGKNKRGIDLVSGGPPCQSFSMAGLRNKDSYKNTLPWDFANFVEMVKPKIVLLENVSGILRPFSNKSNGKKYYAYYEVAKAFSIKGYIPICLHINAKQIGAPQNRPRFIMMAISANYFKKIKKKLISSTAENSLILTTAEEFYKKIKGNDITELSDLKVWDSNKQEHADLFSNSFLSDLTAGGQASVKDAINDLLTSNRGRKSNYVSTINRLFGNGNINKSEIKNHAHRKHSKKTIERFKYYQLISNLERRNKYKFDETEIKNNKIIISEFKKITSGKLDVFSKETKQHLNKTLNHIERLIDKYPDLEEVVIRLRSLKEPNLRQYSTRKHSQKALIAELPAPAALSIPDDVCHYSESEPRTLTVRELARIQTFPDNFIFRNKVTTGGERRRFEVPQYTQVGNSVPPLLARAIGLSVNSLLEIDLS